MRSVKDKNEIAVYTLRVPKGQLDLLHEIAAAEHRTLVQKLRLMIEQEIARVYAERAAA